MTLSIIIVSYNVKDLLEKCLASVSRATETIDSEVFIVDNASTDGSAELLPALFPGFHFINNTTNTGFAKANNQALALCTGEFVLFLNPDTLVPADCFQRCIAFMHEHPEAGALGVKMLNGDYQFLKESRRGIPGPMTSFWKLSGVIKLFPRSKVFAKYYMGHLDENKTSEVEVLSGAFMVVRKKVLEITGGFDERFFR